MRTTSLTTIAFVAALATLPVIAVAAYDTDNLPYTDINASWDLETRVAVSALTDEGILRGNPDGSFAPNRTLNRAEFMQIVMRAMPNSGAYTRQCFPDMPPDIWYEEPVCRAKTLGLISGNALPGLRPDQYPFQPNRAVQYEEALKVLANIYALPVDDYVGGEWYQKYIRAAVNADVELPEGYPGLQITRAEMARLTASFLAYSLGELDDLHDAQGLGSSHSSSRNSSRSSFAPQSSVRSGVGSSHYSLSSFSAASHSFRYDADTNVNQTSHIILLGTTSPVLASIRIFPNNEPVDVTRLLIYMGTIESIDALEVYRADGAYLGRATLDSTEGGYVLRIGSHLLQIDRRTSESVYVRAIVNAENNGGWSGETVLVDHIAVEANGIWSNTTYGFSTSDYFPESVTARARITLVENDGSTTETLIPGTQQIVGEFRIAGAATDSEAGVMIQTLAFQVSRTSEVTLSNVVLGASDTNTTSACSLTNDLVTCASIPAALGDIDDGERRFRLYGDVALASSNQAVLQLILNDAGSPSSSGSITWNDTEAIFIWVDRASSPLARGTLYTR